ncbi:MAG: hypothetical protein JNM31_01980 [Flavobacteriales bacterium]|nr:hypothetical protein [Flavobacteriales bacterium]
MLQINGTQIAGSQPLTDFPVLISLTHPDLRTTANGGYIQQSNALDIVFTLDDCSTILPHQRERYVALTGELIVWVKAPVLTPGQDLVILMFYGRSGGVPDPSSTDVWDTNYMGVWHFNNSLADGTSNGNNLTNSVAPATSNQAFSKIGQGRDLNNSTNVNSNFNGQHLRLPNNFLAGVQSFSFEGWVWLDRTETNWERIFDLGASTTRNFFFTPTSATGNPAETRVRITTIGIFGEQGPMVANSGIQTGAWVHWAVTYDASAQVMRVYRNGALYGSATATTLPSAMESSTANYFGRSQYNADHYIDAKFDEFRMSRTARPAGWVTTSYNNQNTPGSFYTVSGQVPASDFCSVVLPVELVEFHAQLFGSDAVQLRWSTASEKDNDHFAIERSVDARYWEDIAIIRGAGNSQAMINYEHTDRAPLPGISFYRLRQSDHDGRATWSERRSIYRPWTNSDAVLIPNPATHGFTLSALGDGALVLLDLTGRPVMTGRFNELVAVDKLPSGHYLVVAEPTDVGMPIKLPLLIIH